MPRPVDATKHSRFILLCSIGIIIAGLYFGQEVLIPIALAVLLSFLLSPVVRWLERIRFPRSLATITVVLVGVCLLGGIGYLAGRQVYNIINDLPKYQTKLHDKWQRLGQHGVLISKAEKGVQAITGGSSTTQPEARSNAPLAAPPILLPDPSRPSQPTAENPVPVRLYPESPKPVEMLRDYASKALSPLFTAGLVLVFVIFMLISREDLRDRIIRLLGHGRLNLTTQALDEAATRISGYLGALAIVNGCYALCTAGGLWLVGKFFGHGDAFPNVLVWGLLVGLFRFVPYIGIWMGAALPLLLSFALFDGNGVFFGTVSLFVILEIIVGQFIEPLWYGSSTGMSALAVLVAAVFWAWLWGGVGLLLSTPLTVILVVMGKYVPQLKFLDILLREEAVLSPPYRFYQRLIALDQEEAADLARDFLKEKLSLEAVYDEVLIHALSMAEHDSLRDRLGDEQLKFVRESVRDLVEELAEQYRSLLAPRGISPNGTQDPNVQPPTMMEAAASSVAGAAASVAAVASNLARAVTGAGSAETTVLWPAAKNLAQPSGDPNPLPDLPRGCTINVLCLPAGDMADEIVGMMLAQLLQARGYCAEAPSTATLASEMVEMIEAKGIDLICVSAMPPAAVPHARYICKRIQARHPNIGVVVGLWTMKANLNPVRERLACSTSVRLATTLRDAQEQLEQIAHPLIIRASAKPGSEAISPAPIAASGV